MSVLNMSVLGVVAFITPFILMAIAWLIQGIAIWKKWESPERLEVDSLPRKAPATSILTIKTWFHHVIRSQPWTLALITVIAALLIGVVLLAPPRLTGEISTLPGLPGRPFYGLRWLRNSLDVFYDLFWIWSTLLCSLISLATLTWAVVKRSRQAVDTGLLLISLTLASLGQWMLGARESSNALIAYGIAIAGFLFWVIRARRRIHSDLGKAVAVPRRLEILFLVGLLALTAYTRLYAFPAVPYGIEGDEAKWTSEAVNVMLDGHIDTSGEYHRDALPVSFYMQAIFHRILGASIFAARLEVILFSIAGTLIFYWLIRQIAPTPLAGIAAFLLACSIFDISASRLANVESHVKFWPILTLALLAVAIRAPRWQVYLLAGMALAFGVLTYDTVWPLLLIMLLLACVEIFSRELEFRKKTIHLAALIFPVLLALPLVIPYAVSRFGYYDIANKGWSVNLWATFADNFSNVISSWFYSASPDFIYNRNGPLLNAALLPWLAMGFIAALFAIRRRVAGWNLAWALFIIFPVPILTSSPLGRVYYPALPAVYALVALGMYIFWMEISRMLNHWKVVVAALSVAAFFWLPLLNLYIYFNEVADPQDRQIRREIGEIAGVAGGLDSLILLPTIPNADEPLNNEHQIIELYLHRNLPSDRVPSGYQHVPYDDFLASIQSDFSEWEFLEIILDKSTPNQRAERDLVAATLLECFPNGRLTAGVHFDRYTLDVSARNHTNCLPVDLSIETILAYPYPSLVWSLSDGYGSQLRVYCDRELEQLAWVEAERFNPGPGWKTETAFVNGWYGSGFLMDSYPSQYANYPTSFPTDRIIYTWIRYYKRVVDTEPALFTLDDQTIPFANIPIEKVNTWIWERIGPYLIRSDTQNWILSRPYQSDPSRFMSLFIDSVVFSADASFNPMTSATQESIPEFRFSLSNSSNGEVTLPLPPGRYRCHAEIDSPLPLVDTFGNSSLPSNTVEFEVNE
ncbi:MAG: glycosyltransferase family 39 protein [Chloroflexota bacterium]